MLEKDESLDSVLGTVTQSGSSEGIKGFGALLGFRMADWPGPLGRGAETSERAIFPFSSHHLWRSELAGGRPGSIASYPINSSSSVSSPSKSVAGPPTSAFRFS